MTPVGQRFPVLQRAPNALAIWRMDLAYLLVTEELALQCVAQEFLAVEAVAFPSRRRRHWKQSMTVQARNGAARQRKVGENGGSLHHLPCLAVQSISSQATSLSPEWSHRQRRWERVDLKNNG